MPESRFQFVFFSAHEAVAAFFGYKSHAARLADKRYSADDVDLAAILIPDEFKVAERFRDLKELPEKLPQARCLVDNLVRLLLGDGRRCAGRIAFEEPEVDVVGILRENSAATVR